MNETLVDYIEKSARYAIRSYSRDLVYQVIGMNNMAYWLQAISKEDWSRIDHLLIYDTLNNAEWIQYGAKYRKG